MRIESMVGGNVRRIREMRLGWSQERLGAAVGATLGTEPLTRAAVSQYELGHRSFTIASLVAFAHALGVLPGALLIVPEDVDEIDLGGSEPLTRGDVQRPGDTFDPDSASERVFELTQGLEQAVRTNLLLRSQIDAQQDQLSDLHELAMQVRVAQVRYTQGTTTTKESSDE